MTKEELVDGMLKTYLKYEHLLSKWADITKEKFLKWLDSLDNYDIVRKANAFMHSGDKHQGECFLRKVLAFNAAYRVFNRADLTDEKLDELWTIQIGLQPKQDDVAFFRYMRGEVKMFWSTRPKGKRKSE